MITIITKDNCQKCKYIKDVIKRLDLHDKVEILLYQPGVVSPENAEVLSLMAFYEIVGLSETTMPIMVLDDGRRIETVVINMTHILEGI